MPAATPRNTSGSADASPASTAASVKRVDPSPGNAPAGHSGLAERIQRFFVRRRTFFTMVIPLALVLVAKPRTAWLPWGIAVSLGGELVRIWAAGHLTKGTRLTTSGPFARVRHPLYLGSLLIATGYCFMSGLWFAFPVVWLLYILFFGSAMFHEEKVLELAFGEDYRIYKARIPRLLPGLTSFPSPARQFSCRQAVINREPRVALGVLVILGLFLGRWVLLR